MIVGFISRCGFERVAHQNYRIHQQISFLNLLLSSLHALLAPLIDSEAKMLEFSTMMWLGWDSMLTLTLSSNVAHSKLICLLCHVLSTNVQCSLCLSSLAHFIRTFWDRRPWRATLSCFVEIGLRWPHLSTFCLFLRSEDFLLIYLRF